MKFEWLKTENWFDFIKHLFYVVAICIIVVTSIFYLYMPFTTNHGETITVPDVKGMTYEELNTFLTSRNLRFEVMEDSSYSPNFPPLSVLKQTPAPNTKVKEKRKIYVSLNAGTPPLIRMPDLVEGSLKSAQMVLKTYDLILGKIDYSTDLAFGAVLAQRINGITIRPGSKIPKGSVIDLIVGDGLGNQSLESPNIIGLDEESARIAVIGSGLQVGEIVYMQENEIEIEEMNEDSTLVKRMLIVGPGSVTKQRPSSGTPMRLMQKLDFWIYKPDSEATGSSILDQ